MTPFPKELTISFSLRKSVISKKKQNQNKAAFFAHFYSKNLEVNNSRTLIKRYVTISRFIFHIEAVISLQFFNLCDCTFQAW